MKFIKKIITFFKVFFQKRKLRQQNKKYKVQPMGASFINPNATVINVGGETSVLDVDLISDKLTNNEKKKLRQTTKLLIWTLVVCAIVWITWSYVLSTISLVMYGNAEPLSDLSKEVCTVILGTIVGYMCKSFVETFAQKTSEMIERRWNNTRNNYILENETNDEQAVG